MTPVELAAEIELIYGSIKAPLDRNPAGLMDELESRCGWLARSAELLAEAQFILDRKRGEEAERLTDLPWSVGREVLAGRSAEEARLMKLADKLHSTLVHQVEAIRSILSFEKSLSMNTGRQ